MKGIMSFTIFGRQNDCFLGWHSGGTIHPVWMKPPGEDWDRKGHDFFGARGTTKKYLEVLSFGCLRKGWDMAGKLKISDVQEISNRTHWTAP